MRYIKYEPAILSLMKQCIEYYYGDTFENLLEKAEQKVVLERQKAEQKIELERQKAEQKTEKAIRNLYRNLGLDAVNIASLLELDIKVVEAIIQQKSNKFIK
ncbi:MAG: hypothetical protein ACPG5B_13465 [Chitinophagales bacterium]